MPHELSITELARQRQREECLAPRNVKQGWVTTRGGTQKSLALACHPSQVAEFNENARKQGCTAVSFNKDGTCNIPSIGKQRNAYLKYRGVFNKDSYY